MATKFLAHLRRQWIGVLALVIALGTGTTYAANTVFSTDIVDGQVKIADIGQGAVATSEVLNDTATGGGLAAADLRSGSVGSAEVADNSLRAADLGVRVRGAKQPDDGSPASTCGEGTDFDECVTVLINLPRPQRLLLIGSGEWQGGSGTTNGGECRFSLGSITQLGLRTFGETSSAPSNPFNFAMNSVTGVLNDGTWEISIDCRKLGGPSKVINAELSVVALGDG